MANPLDESTASRIAVDAVPESTEPNWITCPMCETRFADATGTAHDLSLRKPAASPVAGVSETEVCPECGDKAIRQEVTYRFPYGIAPNTVFLEVTHGGWKCACGNVVTDIEGELARAKCVIEHLQAHPSAEGDGWVAVAERTPEWDGVKDYELVEAYSPAYGEYIDAVDAYWRGPCSAVFNGANFFALTGTRLVDVTHWRPLPAPPACPHP